MSLNKTSVPWCWKRQEISGELKGFRNWIVSDLVHMLWVSAWFSWFQKCGGNKLCPKVGVVSYTQVGPYRRHWVSELPWFNMMNTSLCAECWGNQSVSVFGGQGQSQGPAPSLAHLWSRVLQERSNRRWEHTRELATTLVLSGRRLFNENISYLAQLGPFR